MNQPLSITPFLPAVAGPLPTDTGGAAGGDPGDPGAVFGEALAAALLATLPGPATPAASSTSSSTSLPAPPTAAPGGPDPSGPAPLPGVTAAPIPVAGDDPAAAVPPTRATSAPAHRGAGDALALGDPALSRDQTVGGGGRAGDATGAAPDTATDTAADTAAAPTTGATGTPSVAGTAGARPSVERAIVQQLFPEVTRLVTSTPADRPGTHRITLTLQPAHLGEVRVTLVVKDGAVQVRLAGNAADAAGNAAVHRALSAGVPELQRLLERSGATDARILVRDPAGTTAAPPLAPTAPAGATTSQPGSGGYSADTGGEGAATGNGTSDDTDRRRGRDVPEPPAHAARPAAPIPTGSIPAGSIPAGSIPAGPTTPAGLLDRTL